MMNTKPTVVRLAAGIGLAVLLTASLFAETETAPTRSDATLGARMRELWDAQVTWTRLYVVSAGGGLPDSGFARARFTRCQDDIGTAFAAYYGPKTAAGLSAVLREHIATVASVLSASKSGDTAALSVDLRRLSDNGDSTAAFLGRVNSDWSSPVLRDMLRKYTSITGRMIVLRARSDFAQDIATYGEVHEQAMAVADELSNGILRQFKASPPDGGR